jgi:hypothetical protein
MTLEARVDAVLLPVDAAVVSDDRAKVAGPKLAADARIRAYGKPIGVELPVSVSVPERHDHQYGLA